VKAIRVCPWCRQREKVNFTALGPDLKGRWVAHVDPNIVPKGSLCDGSGRDYVSRLYVVKHDGLGFVKGL
jgi:hypothetical protein